MRRALLLSAVCLLASVTAPAAEIQSPPIQSRLPTTVPTPPPTGTVPTEIMVRVVAHGAMILGDEVGGAKVSITDVASGRLLASGIQQGEPGDQNLIMRTPRIMQEPRYASRAAASFRATLDLDRPTWVDISVSGPLAYPTAVQRASRTILLIPGQDLVDDGIILDLYGYIVQIVHPKPGDPLIAKEDMKLRATIRTLSGAPVRPYGDWDSRKTNIFADVMIGDRIVERVQMFYSGERSMFESPFFVPLPAEAPDGLTLRVVAADRSTGNFGMGEAKYPVLPAQLRHKRKSN
jgi:hypothetical protein